MSGIAKWFRDTTIATIMGIFAGVIVIISILTVSGVFSSNASAQSKPPKSISGTYHQVKSGLPDAVLTASVSSSNRISIDLKMGDTHGTFWVGDFDATRSPSSKFEYTSTGNRDILDASLFGSSEITKKFLYDRGDISFEFSIMGVSTTVHLQQV